MTTTGAVAKHHKPEPEKTSGRKSHRLKPLITAARYDPPKDDPLTCASTPHPAPLTSVTRAAWLVITPLIESKTLNTTFKANTAREWDRAIERFRVEIENNPAYSEAQKQKAFDILEAEFTAWENKAKSSQEFINKMGSNPGGQGSAPDTSNLYPLGATGLGKDVYPFGLPKGEVKKAYEAITRGGNYIIPAKSLSESAVTKTFASVESLLVPQQASGIIGEYFEARLIDHLPVIAIDGPSYQFLQHNYASDTGGPDFVAEGSTKPQWNPASQKVTVTAQKIAAYFNESSESKMDAPQWGNYLINTLFQLIMQKENAAILYGTVSGGLGIQGWSTQAGILTHNASSDPAGSTNLDSLELAINQLRVRSGVSATPNLAIMSPTTWSATRRIKSTTGEYIAGDPLRGSVTDVWGVPVVTTTACHDGDAFLLDTTKFGSVLVREGISTHLGYSGTGLIDNILTVVAEERINLATVIPSAVNYVTNLAVA